MQGVLICSLLVAILARFICRVSEVSNTTTPRRLNGAPLGKDTPSMAQQVITTLIDDVDGSEAAGTVTFGLDGVTYEIDLSDKNADKLRKVLNGYADKARKVNVRGAGKRSGHSRMAGPGEPGKAAKVREWAAAQGIAVPAKGRVPAAIAEQYDAAQGA